MLVDLWTDRDRTFASGDALFRDRRELLVGRRSAHQDRFIVTFDRIVTREDAERVARGRASRATISTDDDAIWIDELFDAEVFDAQGVRAGVVIDVEANPASDIMVLDSGALVPLTFVTRSRRMCRIDVEVPEGLFE